MSGITKKTTREEYEITQGELNALQTVLFEKKQEEQELDGRIVTKRESIKAEEETLSKKLLGVKEQIAINERILSDLKGSRSVSEKEATKVREDLRDLMAEYVATHEHLETLKIATAKEMETIVQTNKELNRREESVKAREAAAVLCSQKVEKREKDMMVSENALAGRIVDVEGRETRISPREEAVSVREAAIEAAALELKKNTEALHKERREFTIRAKAQNEWEVSWENGHAEKEKMIEDTKLALDKRKAVLDARETELQKIGKEQLFREDEIKNKERSVKIREKAVGLESSE